MGCVNQDRDTVGMGDAYEFSNWGDYAEHIGHVGYGNDACALS